MVKKKAKLFTDGEKEFLLNKDSVPKQQRGSYQKRVRERMQDVNSKEFSIALEYLNPSEKYFVIKTLVSSLNLKTAKSILKELSQEVNQANRHGRKNSKKLAKAQVSYEELAEKIDGELTFTETTTLLDELKKGNNLLQAIAKIKKNPEYTLMRKAVFDNEFLQKDKRAMEVFNLVLSKRKVDETKLTSNTLKLGIIKRYLRGLTERGIIACELTKKKNFLKDCQKILIIMEKEGTGRTSSFEIGYKIIPYKDIFKYKKKNYTFEVTEYTNYLAKKLKKPLKGIKSKRSESRNTP